MGAGIVEWLSGQGETVIGFDPREDLCQRIAKLPGVTVGNVRAADVIIEALPENLDLKIKVMEEYKGFTGIWATNTSSFSINRLRQYAPDPGRFLGIHFFNPATKMKLVELIDPPTLDIGDLIKAELVRMGKTVVLCSDSPGFIVNRIARGFYLEALRIFQEGIADIPTIDAVMRDLGGFRMGPFELMDLIGLDTNLAVTESIYKAFDNHPRFRPSLVQRRLVESGALGRKSKMGFYDYRSEPKKLRIQKDPLLRDLGPEEMGLVQQIKKVEVRAVDATTKFASLPSLGWGDRPTGDLVIDFSEQYVDDPSEFAAFLDQNKDRLLLVNTHGTRKAALEEYLHHDCDNVLCMNAVGDAVEIGVHGGIHPQVVKEIKFFLDQLGIRTHLVADTPGFIYRRIVSTIVNEAHWAVQDGVTDPESIDISMKLGVNYPEGPFQLAQRFTPVAVVQTLMELQDWLSSEQYPISGFLRLRAENGL